MLQLQDIDKHYGINTVLDKVCLQINSGEKVGLIGANGTGKTTLLKILMEQLEPDGGQIVTGGATIQRAMLAQEVTVKPYHTLIDEMRSALPEVARMEREIKALEEEMIAFADDGERVEALVAEYGALQERFEQQNGRDLSWKIDLIIQGLGFSLTDKDRSVSEFSGGWHMRIELAKLLLRDVDLLLLDEPTNHLDLAAVRWLEEYLKEYAGAVLIVSHDRYFLNRVVSKIHHLDRGRVKTYTGNYDAFVATRKAERELQEKAYGEQQKQLEKDMRFIERFRYKATLATRVKSREKMVQRMEKVEAPTKDRAPIHVSFDYEESHMTTICQLKNLEKDYDGLIVPLLGDIEIKGGDRLAIVGENGSGKSTLLRILSGEDRFYRGKLKVHPDAMMMHYHQNHQDALNPNRSVLEELQETAPPHLSLRELRTILGCFLFRGDDAFKKVEVLSGGEKARLALAQIVTSPSNILLLDEPTNHLDIDSREALADALKAYEGSIIIVSHDRYFIDQVCTRVIDLDKGTLTSYPGNYSYYRSRKETMERSQASAAQREKDRILKPKKASRSETESRRDAKKRVMELEARITSVEQLIKAIEASFEDPAVIAEPGKLQILSEEYGQKKEALELLFQEYEEAFELAAQS